MGFDLSCGYDSFYYCVVGVCVERIHNRMTEKEARKLKHGDLVKCVHTDASELVEGKIYIVDELIESNSYLYIRVLRDDLDSSRNVSGSDCNDNAYNPIRFVVAPKRALSVDESWKDERDEVFVLNPKRFRNGEVAQRQRR